MKLKSIKRIGTIIISTLLCMALLPINPIHALEDVDMLESIANKESLS